MRRGLVEVLVGLALTACSAPIPPTPPVTDSTPATDSSPAVTASPPSTGEPSRTAVQSPTPEPTPTPVPLTTVTSADGVVTVEVPTHAVPAGVALRVERRAPEQQPPELLDAGIRQTHYALLPPGTLFTEPARVSQLYPLEQHRRREGLPIVFPALRFDDGRWQWLAEAQLIVADQTITFAGSTTHFSALFVWSDRTVLSIDPPAPATHLVGTTFERTVELVSLDERVNPVAFRVGSVAYTNHSPEVIGVDGGGESGLESHRRWTCLRAGDYTLTFAAEVGNFAADNPFWTTTLRLPATRGAISIELTGSCVVDTGLLDSACARVVHRQLHDFRSRLDWLIGLAPEQDADAVEIMLEGANDDAPVRLEAAGDGRWRGSAGLRQPGSKRIISVLVQPASGDPIDITHEVIAALGGATIEVPFPDEAAFGSCPPA